MNMGGGGPQRTPEFEAWAKAREERIAAAKPVIDKEGGAPDKLEPTAEEPAATPEAPPKLRVLPSPEKPALITRDNPLKMTVGKFYQDTEGKWRKITRGKPESDVVVTTPKLIKRLAKRAEERAAGTEKPKRIGLSPDDFGASAETPVATGIIEHGKLMSKSTAKKKGLYEKNKEQWDGAPTLAHASHNKIYAKDGGELPDVMASSLGLEGSGEMWTEVEKESRSTRNRVKEGITQRKVEQEALQQVDDFEKARAAEEKAGKPGVMAAEMDVGHKVKIGGEQFEATDLNPDDMSVTLKDGKKYGTQIVSANEMIHGEHEAKPPGLAPIVGLNKVAQKLFGKDFDELTPQEQNRVRNSDEYFTGEFSKVPGLTEGEQKVLAQLERAEGSLSKTGKAKLEQLRAKAKGEGAPEAELLSKEEMPFSLEIEKPSEPGLTAEGAARKKAEAEARQKKEQMNLFDLSMDLRNRLDKSDLNSSIFKDATEIGRRIYKRGMSYAEWAVDMVRYLGDKIRKHLSLLWDKVAGVEEHFGFTTAPKEGYSHDPSTGYRYAMPDVIRLNARHKTASYEFIQAAQNLFETVDSPSFYEVTLPKLGHGTKVDEGIKDPRRAQEFASKNGETINYYYGRANNRGFQHGSKIFLNVNAFYRPGGALQFVVGHEFGHVLKVKYPELWRKLVDSLKEKSETKYWSRLLDLGYNPRKWTNEFVSDFIGKHWLTRCDLEGHWAKNQTNAHGRVAHCRFH